MLAFGRGIFLYDSSLLGTLCLDGKDYTLAGLDHDEDSLIRYDTRDTTCEDIETLYSMLECWQ